jgi:hypothetical protein
MLDLEETNNAVMGGPPMQMAQHRTDSTWTQTYTEGHINICEEIGVSEAAQIPRAEPQCDEPEPMNICYLEDSLGRLPVDFTELSLYNHDANMLLPNTTKTAKADGSVKDYREALNIGIFQVPIRPAVPVTIVDIEMSDMCYEIASEDMADGTEQVKGSEEIATAAISSEQLTTSNSISETASTVASDSKEKETPIEDCSASPSKTETSEPIVAQIPQTAPLDKKSEEPLIKQRHPEEGSLDSKLESQREEELSIGSSEVDDRDSDQTRHNHFEAQRAYRQKQKQGKAQKHEAYRAQLKVRIGCSKSDMKPT